MAVTLQPLDNLDSDLVAQNLSEATQRVQESNPDIDVRLGVFHNLVLYFSAALAAQRQQWINDYLRARSLQDLLADATLIDSDLVDAVASNFRITRQAGSAATGTVTVVLDDSTTVVLAAGSELQSGDRTFTSAATYTAKADADQVIAADDRLLRALPDGNFAFDITVTATATGNAGNLAKNTTLVPENPPLGFVTAYAATSFTGGADEESDATLLDQLQNGIAARTVSNRVNMAAFLRGVSTFSRVTATSIVGYGDPEMLRDQHGLWPVSGGGRIDWYVRTQEQIHTVGLTKTAKLVEKTEDGYGIWQFGIHRSEAPGFYEITNIRPEGATVTSGGYEITTLTRSLDLTVDANAYSAPDVANVTEGAFSRFQAAVVKFKDTQVITADLSIGAARTYDLDATSMPLIADIQDTVSARDYAGVGADILVRAPVPCFVQLTLEVFRPRRGVAPDTAALQTALAAAANQTGFTGKLYAQTLTAAVRDLLPAGATLGNLDMLGRLCYPDDTITYLRSTEVLTIPDDPAKTVSKRTVQFFAATADISINVTVG